MTNREFIDSCVKAAVDAGHIFPEYAACEAALESNFGKSKLAKEANNLFGQKQSRVPIYNTYIIATDEYIGGKWIKIEAKFVQFPTVSDCFKSRMQTLQRLRGYYVEYDNALKADNGEEFVRQVSARWATDPKRANSVLALHKQYFGS